MISSAEVAATQPYGMECDEAAQAGPEDLQQRADPPPDSCDSVPSPPDDKPRCDLCGCTDEGRFSNNVLQRFRRNYNLAQGLASWLPPSSKPIRCISCTEAVRTVSESEQKRYAEELMYQCCECRRLFKRGDPVNGLSKHQRRKNLMEQRCPVCAAIRDGHHAQLAHQKTFSFRLFLVCKAKHGLPKPC